MNKVISYDPQIADYDPDGTTLLFTDITQNISDRNRIIVARDQDGTLRQASWEERDKLNRIYFPQKYREVKAPKMFTDVNILKEVLARATPEDNTYEFILDRACVQFEPDDPMYITAVEVTYETIDSKGHYDYLKSTRHYGPLVFHLLRHRKVDNLLMFNLDNDRISDVGQIVGLFTLIFPESKTAKTVKSAQDNEEDAVSGLQSFIDFDSVLNAELQVHFNAFMERRKGQESLEEGLKQSHGL